MYYEAKGEKNTKKELLGEIARLTAVVSEHQKIQEQQGKFVEGKQLIITALNDEKRHLETQLGISEQQISRLGGRLTELVVLNEQSTRERMRADGMAFEDIERIIREARSLGGGGEVLIVRNCDCANCRANNRDGYRPRF